jgi:alkylation response protein AidB-like acyl-CoA dehydrogenase
MLDLKITPEQRMAREQARKWLKNELEQHCDALDRHEMLPYDLVKRFMREVQGVDTIETVDQLEEFHKTRNFITSALIGVEVTRVSPGFAMAMGASFELSCFAVLYAGTREQKEKYALPLARFDKIGCWALTEPGAGSDITSMKTVAKKDGDNYILNGSKTFITNAPHADIMVVVAKTEMGFSQFILERGMEGLTTGEPLDKMGMRASPTGEIFMDDVRVSADRLLGVDGRGLLDAFAVLQNERAKSPTMGIGIMERCLDEAVRYSKQREQFGKPIIAFQSLQFMMARMWEAIMGSYAYLFMLGELKSQGVDITIPASAGKLYSTEMATQVALDAIQILGGYGYMKEYKVERFMRDAKLMEIGAGTSQIQCWIMSRKLMEMDDPELNPLFAGPDPFAEKT